jgi:hypothetical protein
MIEKDINLIIEYNKKFIKNKELFEGSHVLLETNIGFKDYFVKSTSKGNLFFEAIEIREQEEIITVNIKEIIDEYYIIPEFDEIIEKLLDKGYKITLQKGNKRIENNIKILEKENFNIMELIEIALE